MEEAVLGPLCFEQRDAQRSYALVERAPLALYGRTNLERARGSKVIRPALCLLQRLRAQVVGQVKPAEADPNFREIGRASCRERV